MLAATRRRCYDNDVVRPPRLALRGLVLALGLVSAAARAAPAGSAQAGEGGALDRGAFHRILDRLLDRYVDPVDEAAVLARALAAAAAALDPYTEFVPADVRRRLERGIDPKAWGLFVSWSADRGALVVDDVLAGSAAARAGLRPGDRIVAAGGHRFARDTGRATALSYLFAPEGDLVRMAVRRPGRPDRAVVVRAATGSGRAVRGMLRRTPAGPVAAVTIAGFRAGTARAARKTLATLRARAPGDLAAIVLDLRGNPGGRVAEALVLADAFVDAGVLVRLRGRGGRILREEPAHAGDTDTKTPLFVLVDRRSASAAELLAAALQDHKRAVVIGERTFGKGTVQEVIGLPDGSALAMTVARYTSPADRVIDGVGVAPDVWTRPGEDPWAVVARLVP